YKLTRYLERPLGLPLNEVLLVSQSTRDRSVLAAFDRPRVAFLHFEIFVRVFQLSFALRRAFFKTFLFDSFS
ncbi:hypothetical protein WJ883_04975, partial [Coxiella burnetii]